MYKPTYDKNSIVDTLKSMGQASDFASRTKLANANGMAGYTGTAEENNRLLKIVANTPTVTSPIIAKQSGIIQSTKSTNAKDTANGAKIDSTVSNTYGTTGTSAGQDVVYVPQSFADTHDMNNPAYKNYKVDPNIVTNTNNQNPTTTPTPTMTAPTGSATTPDGKALTDTVPSGFSYNLPALDDPTKKRMYSPDGHVYTVDAKGVATLDPTGEQEYAKNEEYNKMATERNAMYDSYKQGLDASHQALIDSIKAQADQQRIKMEELNKRTLGLKTVQGYRTGSAEYTPEIDTGILKKEEEEGIARLGEIDANMKIAIAQAVSAKTEKDFELLSKRLDTIDQLQKSKQEAVQTIYKNYIDNAKMISDKLKEADTLQRAQEDQAIQKLDVASDALVTEYDAIKDPAKQKIWVDNVAKKLGLDPALILGSMQKKRLAQQNTQSLINKRDDTGTKPTEASIDRATVSSFASSFEGTDAKGVKLKGADGYVSPQAWSYARQQWGLKGGKDSEFISNFKRYLNPESYDMVGL